MSPSRPEEKHVMQWPLTDPETLFAHLWQDLPPETAQMARECKAFVRAKQVKTPAHLLRVVFFYGGWDTSLREVAGTFTALYETSTDQAVAERWRAGGPWVQALLRRRLPLAQGDTRPAGRRFVVMDARRMPAPGAPGTDPRRHSAMALWSWQFLEVCVSAVHTGATLMPCTLEQARSPGLTAARPSAKAGRRRSRRGPTSWYGAIPAVWSCVTQRAYLWPWGAPGNARPRQRSAH
jgi:hypothetical protein